ncbi:SsgA family sporulation/cell division regulator [Streptomyces sp. NPDC048717]|uniref:SsgA family sporulation/cell division regulator n=1 Tax=unclassified Streptomyces TaxID=2593676 RepID=UPI0034249BE0
MNGEQAGGRTGRTGRTGRVGEAGVPALRLDIRRVLDGVPVQPIGVEFRFDPSSPMVVSATFTPGHGREVTWRIGRGLLYRGLYGESGEGDVQAWPVRGEAADVLWLLLESRESSAVFELPMAEVEGWLDATYGLVPAEAEADALDWAAFLGELLDDREQCGD